VQGVKEVMLKHCMMWEDAGQSALHQLQSKRAGHMRVHVQDKTVFEIWLVKQLVHAGGAWSYAMQQQQ
jgi:hypothetical protein